MPSTVRSLPRAAVGITLVAIAMLLATGFGLQHASGASRDAHSGDLYRLQADFHRAATAHNPDDPEQRVKDMMALWTDDATLTIGGNLFSGKGTPGTASCAPGSGTVCDFFANVSPAFQEEWISLSPSFKTVIDVNGDTASLYYECHFFDLTWTPTVRIGADATATKVNGQWKLSSIAATVIPAPAIPYP